MSIIQIKNLHKRLSNSFSIEVNELNIDEGEKVLLLGQNGSGKSSLLRITTGIWKPDKGEIIRNYKFQSYLPPDFSMIPSVKVKTIWRSWTKIWNNNLERIKPLNVEEVLNHTYKALSDGQKQRLLLSMVLLKHSDIYLLDEPERSLDKNYVNNLIDIFNNIDKTLIVATHSKTLIDNLNFRRIEIKNGRIA